MYDSTRTASLADSAFVVRRDTRDTLYVDEEGRFEVKDVPPGVYLFDANAYGYHPHKHIAAVVRPDDASDQLRIPLLPQTIRLSCEETNTAYHQDVEQEIQGDSAALQLRVLDVLAEGDSVHITSAIVSNVNFPLWMPDNFNRRGHYDVTLTDASGNPIPFRSPIQQDTTLDARRIYDRGDVLVAVPGRLLRLQRRTVVLEDPPPLGETIYARLRYNFSLNDTLRPTPQTNFPPLVLDSLQVPVYDTLRVPEAVTTPDSLVAERDTTIYRITGVDTTVLRRDYVLYKSDRERNATQTARQAASLLYVPDSIKIRARLDSLGGDTTTYEAPPIVENPDGPPLHVISRTDTAALQSFLRSDLLIDALQYGLPRPSENIPQLVSLSEDSLASVLAPPALPPDRRIPLDSLTDFPTVAALAPPDTTASDTAAVAPDTTTATAPSTDDTPVPADTAAAPNPAVATDTTTLPAPASDTLQADTLQADTLQADTLQADTLQADTLQADSLMADSLMADSIAADSLMADSVVVDSADVFEPGPPFLADRDRGDYFYEPAPRAYWLVPRSLTVDSSRVFIVDPLFQRLKAAPAADTSLTDDLTTLVPQQINPGTKITIEVLPQQIVAVPTGGYRQKYLERWDDLQQVELEDPYCDILRLSLQSNWTQTIMREEAGPTETQRY